MPRELANAEANIGECHGATVSKSGPRKGDALASPSAGHDAPRGSANINNGNQQYHLGYFDNDKHAARVYNINAVDMFGEYAKLNDVSDDEQDQRSEFVFDLNRFGV